MQFMAFLLVMCAFLLINHQFCLDSQLLFACPAYVRITCACPSGIRDCTLEQSIFDETTAFLVAIVVGAETRRPWRCLSMLAIVKKGLSGFGDRSPTS